MALEIKVPTVGESINEVTLVKWLKPDGSWVERDEVLAELESEKATFEINAVESGVLKILAAEGDTLKIGDIACSIDTSAPKPEGIQTSPKSEVSSVSVSTPPPAPAAAPIQPALLLKRVLWLLP